MTDKSFPGQPGSRVRAAANDNTPQPRACCLPYGVAPRGLRRTEAAAYVGVSPSLFDEMVADGRMPQPKIINARTVWDRLAIDEAFDALPCKATPEANPWDEAA